MELKEGDKAPAFTAEDQNGNKVSLKDYAGKKVVLYFYPEDDTPTCTTEACNLRDNIKDLEQHDVVVLGVSPDGITKHKKFVEKYNLPYTLLADPDKKIIEKYGVWGEKQMYGRKFMGLKRTTFLINEDGKIDHVIKKVLSKTHTDQIKKKWELN